MNTKQGTLTPGFWQLCFLFLAASHIQSGGSSEKLVFLPCLLLAHLARLILVSQFLGQSVGKRKQRSNNFRPRVGCQLYVEVFMGSAERQQGSQGCSEET